MIDSIKYFTKLEVLLVILLHSNQNEPITGRIWLQKIMFVLDRNIEDIKAAFEGSYIGPYSEKVEIALEQFISSGLVTTKSHKIYLTKKGELLAKELMNYVSDERKKIIKDVKIFLNRINRKELISFIYSSFPTYTEDSQIKEEFESFRLESSISLYKKGRVSLSKAAEISGYELQEYIKLIKEMGR